MIIGLGLAPVFGGAPLGFALPLGAGSGASSSSSLSNRPLEPAAVALAFGGPLALGFGGAKKPSSSESSSSSRIFALALAFGGPFAFGFDGGIGADRTLSSSLSPRNPDRPIGDADLGLGFGGLLLGPVGRPPMSLSSSSSSSSNIADPPAFGRAGGLKEASDVAATEGALDGARGASSSKKLSRSMTGAALWTASSPVKPAKRDLSNPGVPMTPGSFRAANGPAASALTLSNPTRSAAFSWAVMSVGPLFSALLSTSLSWPSGMSGPGSTRFSTNCFCASARKSAKVLFTPTWTMVSSTSRSRSSSSNS
mmetsp:Transcript_12282/g.30680  ORF Transcript_12282/g.30680 Transcript_12282/m.30680 type:complete len:310 (-) Transcript_12282:125-1054(-)